MSRREDRGTAAGIPPSAGGRRGPARRGVDALVRAGTTGNLPGGRIAGVSCYPAFDPIRTAGVGGRTHPRGGIAAIGTTACGSRVARRMAAGKPITVRALRRALTVRRAIIGRAAIAVRRAMAVRAAVAVRRAVAVRLMITGGTVHATNGPACRRTSGAASPVPTGSTPRRKAGGAPEPSGRLRPGRRVAGQPIGEHAGGAFRRPACRWTECALTTDGEGRRPAVGRQPVTTGIGDADTIGTAGPEAAGGSRLTLTCIGLPASARTRRRGLRGRIVAALGSPVVNVTHRQVPAPIPVPAGRASPGIDRGPRATRPRNVIIWSRRVLNGWVRGERWSIMGGGDIERVDRCHSLGLGRSHERIRVGPPAVLPGRLSVRRTGELPG